MNSYIVRNIKVCLVCAAAAGASGCASFIPAHSQSYQRTNERVDIAIHHKTKARALPALAAAAIPTAADYALKFATDVLKKEAELFTADYSASTSDDLFYVPGARGLVDATEAREINIDRITITRFVQVDNHDEVPAFTVDIAMRPSFDQTAFQLVPLRARMDYSKIKVARRTWTRPWTYGIPADDRIDVNVDVQIDAFWVDEEGKSQARPVANLQIPLRGLKLGGERTHFPGVGSEWFPAIPASVVKEADGTLLYGTGNYVFRARITEVDDAAKRLTKYSDTLDDNREAWMKKLLKNLKD